MQSSNSQLLNIWEVLCTILDYATGRTYIWCYYSFGKAVVSRCTSFDVELIF